METGKVKRFKITRPKSLGKRFLYSEQVYLPDADLILLMRLFSGPDGKLGNVAWSPEDKKFYWIALKWIDNGKPVLHKKNPFSWSSALKYDPELKLVLLNNIATRKIWVLKFDSKTAKLEEVKE